MSKLRQQLNVAAILAAGFFGRFGDDMESRKDYAPQKIEGTGAGKRASRHKVKKPKERAVRLPAFGQQARLSEYIYSVLTSKQSRHGRCDDWIRENRRRRAAGLPQLRSRAVFRSLVAITPGKVRSLIDRRFL